MKRSRITTGARAEELLLAPAALEFGDTDEDVLHVKLRLARMQTAEFAAKTAAADAAAAEDKHGRYAELLSDAIAEWDMEGEDGPMGTDAATIAELSQLELLLIFAAIQRFAEARPLERSKS